ncbi:MAG: TIGR00282 family metallophosphoesterase [Bryobacteraceae bacterium]
MNILFIGDIFASAGREIVGQNLHGIMDREAIDLVIANVENSAGGFGVTPQIAEEMLKLGVDIMTTGNHVWDRREVYEYIEHQPLLLRPANYPPETPGRGIHTVKARNGVMCAVMNLQGRTHMAPIDCPFRKADELLASLEPEVKVRFVDFHAEATSEKSAMGWYLDGRVTAVVGTHTHVPTADARLLPNGTAFQTDVGMTGPYDSIIGVEKDPVLKKFLTAMPVRMEAAKQRVELRAVVVDADEGTGRARSIRPIMATIERP